MYENVKLRNLLRSCELIYGLTTARLAYRTIGDVTWTAVCWARYAYRCSSRSV